MGPQKRAARVLVPTYIIAVLVTWLAVSGIPLSQASTAGSTPAKQSRGGAAPGIDRRAALEKLNARFQAGEPFSTEEADILRRFNRGESVAEIEADTLISRALYHYHVTGEALTRDEESLLARYRQFVSRRQQDILDRKAQLLEQRRSAEAAAGPKDFSAAAAPANDACANAELIPAAGPFPYSTAVTADITDATTAGDPAIPSCAICSPAPCTPQLSRSIWYRFTPSQTGTYTISSCADAPTGTTVDDTVMGIYTSTGGCAGPFTEIPTSGLSDGCGDDECGNEAFQAEIMTQLSGGTTYYVVVWLYGTAAPAAGNTAVQLRVSRSTVPSNDTCATAGALALNTPVAGTSVGSANDYQLSGSACFTGIGNSSSTATGRDVVYSFTAPSAGQYSFRVTKYSTNNNLVMYVASSCPAATPGTPVTVTTCLAAANRTSFDTAEEVSCISLSSGQQVFIFVDEDASSEGSNFTIEASRCSLETEPNNTPATAGVFVLGKEGATNTAGDADFYSLGTPASGSRVFALVDGVAASSNDFDLRVTTATDTLEYDDLNADAPFGSLSATVGGTPTNGTQTFLRVSQFFSSATSEPYRLYAVVQPPIASASSEGETSGQTGLNDSIATAVMAANNYFAGTLAGSAPSADIDIFKLTATAGNVIFASLDGDPLRNNTPLNAMLTLMDSSGVVLVEVNDGGATSNTTVSPGTLAGTTPNSPAESLVYRVTTTGTYYVKVAAGTTSAIPSGAGDYLLSLSQGATGPTAVRFSDYEASGAVKASRLGELALLEWRTAYEVDNLGFNIYREEGGRRVRVNSQMIAGSALTFGPGLSLESGRSYSWLDVAAVGSNAKYWIEDIDVEGRASWHGPVALGSGPDRDARSAIKQQSLTLSQLNVSEGASAPVGSVAILPEMSVAGLAAQAGVANTGSIKLAIREEGLYRVSLSDLVAAGLDAGAPLANLQLYVDGEEQPLKIAGEKEGKPSIEFYGIGIDSPYTAARVYWVVAGAQPGKRMEHVTANKKRAAAASFPYTVERKDRTIYLSSIKNGQKENFFGAVISREPVEQALTVRNIDAAAVSATLEIVLQGVTAASHRVQVEVNGTPAGTIAFEGQAEAVATFSLAQAVVKEGQNVVKLTPLAGDSDVSFVDVIRLTYNHRYSADSNALRFTAGGKQFVTVDGFTSPSVRVFDVTDAGNVRELTVSVRPGVSGYAASVSVPGKGTRTLMAVGDDQFKRVVSVAPNHPSNLRESSNEADFVIITRRDFFAALEPLKQLRERQGLKVLLADVEDVYDEFSFGQKTPQAIKDFLAHAKDGWKTAPRYVMLAGDASYDPKNYMGFGDNDIVPTRLVETAAMETASDDWFADFDSDGVPEMAVGRLPVRTAQDMVAVVAKIVRYEEARPSGGVLLVTDANDGFDFEATSTALRSLIPDYLRVEEVNRAGAEAEAVKARMLDAINRGQKIVNYMGHGSTDLWRGELLTTRDAQALANPDSLPVFITMTCLNGHFHDAARDSLAESLVKASRGGAVAAWASSGMSGPQSQALMDQEIFKWLLGKSANSSVTLGDAAVKAKLAASDEDARRTWILFGDPTMRLR